MSNERASSSQRSKGTFFLAAVTVQTTQAWSAVTVKSKKFPINVDEASFRLQPDPFPQNHWTCLESYKDLMFFLFHSSHEPARRS